MQVSEQIQQAYSNQYDPSIVAWRTMAAKYKAQNIVNLAKNINYNTVLEVGCGEGSILSWLSQWGFGGQLSGIDISDSGVAITQSKNIDRLKEVLLFDGYRIPYPNGHFDLAYCSHVLEHVEHERVLLREIQRVSRYQIFEVPIDFSFYVDRKLAHFLSYGHINIYTPSLFRFLLKTENYQILADECYMYNNEVLNYTYPNNKGALLKAKAKNMLLNMIPYLKGIKPNSYAVLTQKAAAENNIF
jgi:ubiquinone/menaquinone biosynthesis C-methylase UbiE